MADDIQSSFKELVGNAARERSDFKTLAMLALGLAIGLFIGYQMNLEKDAQVRADKDCGLCQSNIETMVSNFNVLAKQCSQAQPFARNISILPGIIDEKVSVYAS